MIPSPEQIRDAIARAEKSRSQGPAINISSETNNSDVTSVGEQVMNHVHGKQYTPVR